jgi:hypothetical protein
VLGGWRDASGYEPVRLASVDTLLDPIKAAARKETLESKESILDTFAIDRLAYWSRVTGNVRFMARTERSSSARALLWANWRTVGSASEAFGIVGSPRWEGTPVAVTDWNPVLPSGMPAPLPTQLKVYDRSPDTVEVILPLQHDGGMVVLADAGYPGWSVTVDGKPAGSLRINGAFRGVVAGKNAGIVRWTFEPSTWRFGMFTSLVTVGIMSVIVAPSVLAFVRRSGLMSRYGTI